MADEFQTYRQTMQASENAALRRYRALKGDAARLEALEAATAPLKRQPYDDWEPVKRLTDEERELIP